MATVGQEFVIVICYCILVTFCSAQSGVRGKKKSAVATKKYYYYGVTIWDFGSAAALQEQPSFFNGIQ